jgi:ATP-dependent HslUV protease ATP-binding subunit HslU
MIGPTGVGKTEIARRLARLADAPFIKVEATKFTEVGYVGKDVDTIVRDLVDVAVKQERERQVRKAHRARWPRTPPRSASSTCWCRPRSSRIGLRPTAPAADNTARQVMRKRLREGTLDDKEIEIELAERQAVARDPGPAGHGRDGRAAQGPVLADGPGQAQDAQAEDRRGAEAAGRRRGRQAGQRGRDPQRALAQCRAATASSSSTRSTRSPRAPRHGGADVSRQGVQRDLLPLVEGTTVNTKYGMVKTDHILFIASGAFHLAKPSDLIPELQGRFPIRVELARCRSTTSRPSSPAPRPAWSSSTRRCWPPRA